MTTSAPRRRTGGERTETTEADRRDGVAAGWLRERRGLLRERRRRLHESPLGATLARLRQPEYVGENRCLPCTVVNLAFVAAAGTALAIVSPAVALVVVAVGLLATWLRGYVVPYTPTLTGRYLPERVLSWFGKASTPPEPPVRSAAPEGLLEDTGLLQPTPSGDDVRLDGGFAAAWLSGTRAALAEETGERTALAKALDLDRDRLVVTTYDDGVVAYLEGEWLGTWESQAALFADTTAFDLLPEWVPEWEQLGPAARTEAAASLRLFAEVCPECGGAVELGEEPVPSCCSSRRVIAVGCVDCGCRLLEVRIAAADLE